jgi:hypothetical protein
VAEEISQGLQQQRTETTSVAVGALKKRSLQQVCEKILREILCILGRVTAAADIGEDRPPIGLA